MFNTIDRAMINEQKLIFAAMYSGYRAVVRHNIIQRIKEMHQETPIEKRRAMWYGEKQILVLKLRAIREIEGEVTGG
jgi:hypothetical protein